MKVLFISKKILLSYVTISFIIVSIFYVSSLKLLPSSTADNRLIPIYSVDRDDNRIAITFDVAWDDKDTVAIMNILNKYNVKASFFIVGEWLEKYPESAKLIRDNKHEILNHSDNHPYMTKLSDEEIKTEILDCDTKIYKLTGKKMGLFRPPYGDYNNNVVAVADAIDHKVIQWDVDSLDWQDLSANQICERVIGKVKSGSIILLHLGAKNTPEALPLLLKRLLDSGYKPVKVSKLIYDDNYTIDHTGMQIKSIEN